MKVFITICLFCFSAIVIAQNKIIDSLKVELRKKPQDSIKGELFGELAYYYSSQNTDSSLSYASKLHKLSDKIESKRFKILANKYKGTAYLVSNQYDSARYYYTVAMKQSEAIGLSKSAFYTNLGVLHKREGDFESALELYLEGYEYDKANNNEYGQFLKLLNISNLYGIYYKDNNLAIEYAKKGLEISDRTTDLRILNVLGTLLNNIGTLYIEKGNIEQSLKYFKSSLEYNQKYDNQREIARNYNNIGATYTDMGDIDKAIDYLQKALQIRKEINDKVELVETNMSLGTAFGKINQKTISEKYFSTAKGIAMELKNLPLISETYLAMSNTASDWEQPQKAFTYYQQYIVYRDSVFNKENLEHRNELEAKFETEKKDKEIAEQQLAIEQQDLKLEKQQSKSKLMTGLVIALLLTSILTWFLYQQRQKRKDQEIVSLKREQQVKTLELLMEGEEKERLRIAQELHDGVNVDLSAIKYKLTSILEKNNTVINEAVAMIDKSCEQVRAISHNLVPPALKDFSLIEALQDYCGTTNTIHSVDITFQSIGSPFAISKKIEVNIFRIVQELVNNSLKHAEATEIDVQISHQGDVIQITIEDNGKGFDLHTEKNNGIGLQNVKSRIKYLNAKLDVTSDNKGTSYVIDINIKEIT